MRTFRFRAAAILDKRREEETEALRDLARVQARFHEATTALEVEGERRKSAEADLVASGRQGCDADMLLWHRNWIVRLAANVERLRRDLDERASDVGRARLTWQDARSRRLALERMKERAWRRFRQAEQQQAAKELDELARIRFVASEQWRPES